MEKTTTIQQISASSLDDALQPDYIDPSRLWMMTRSEQCCLRAVLERLRPQCALEIGTANGGSLQVISHYAQKTWSLDIDPSVRQKLEPQFPSVEFMTGQSASLIPQILQRIESEGLKLEFVLIDGDHSTEGVRRDIENVLAYRPPHRMVILMHDSFYASVRRGILSAPWHANPHVHFLEIDFCNGAYYGTPERYRAMRGGLAIAVLEPVPRTNEFIIEQSNRFLYETLLPWSADAGNFRSVLIRLRHHGWSKVIKRLKQRKAR